MSPVFDALPPHPPISSQAETLVGCGVYVDGHRLPDTHTYVDGR